MIARGSFWQYSVDIDCIEEHVPQPEATGSSTTGGVPSGGEPSSDDDSAAGEPPAGSGCRTLATDAPPLTLLGLLGLGVLGALRRRR